MSTFFDLLYGEKIMSGMEDFITQYEVAISKTDQRSFRSLYVLVTLIRGEGGGGGTTDCATEVYKPVINATKL